MRTVGFTLLFAGVILIGYFGYKHIHTIRTKEEAMDYLETIGKGSMEKMQSFGEDYLIAFANAAKNNKRSFVVAGKTYTTQTGKSIMS